MNHLIALCFLFLIFGFKFNPMSQSIELGEGKKVAQFLIENEGSEPMAIDFKVTAREMDETGKEQHPPTSDLTVFPPQLIVPPKEKRTVRVSWVSKEVLTSEKAYRVIAEQLPLDVSEKQKKKSGIQMLMKFVAALYVTPENVAPALAAKIAEDADGRKSLLITNSGTRHQVLIDPTIVFENGGKKMSLSGESLNGLAGENVLAQGRRKFVLKDVQTMPTESKVTIRLNE